MSKYLSLPLLLFSTDSSIRLEPTLSDTVAMLDNLIELAVFTPRGSFTADPDFGFEYWNYEYVNIDIRGFNDGQRMSNSDVSKQICEDSIKDSITAYDSNLKKISASMELKLLSHSEQRRRKTSSRYEVVVRVTGELDDGLGTMRPYYKEVRFLMEPVAKSFVF